jgi:hypothetical protein
VLGRSLNMSDIRAIRDSLLVIACVRPIMKALSVEACVGACNDIRHEWV